MKAILRTFFTVVILLFSAGVWAQESASAVSDEQKSFQFLKEGARYAASGKQAEAIPNFEKAAAIYEEKYRDEKSKVFTARWPTESLMYLVEGASTNTPTKVASAYWSDAYYLKAYSLIELGRLSEAKELLGKAIALSPHNAQYLSELGNIYQSEKNWAMALQNFKNAETEAKVFSPPALKNTELSRAWRGIGYVYVEQNKFDDAEKMYRQCLELDSNDKRAQSELAYVQMQRAKLKQ